MHKLNYKMETFRYKIFVFIIILEKNKFKHHKKYNLKKVCMAWIVESNWLRIKEKFYHFRNQIYFIVLSPSLERISEWISVLNVVIFAIQLWQKNFKGRAFSKRIFNWENERLTLQFVLRLPLNLCQKRTTTG